jgi:hypothetical protein
MLDTATTAKRPPTVRSALTNNQLALRGIDGRRIDGRSMAARRYRDVVISLTDELGGEAVMTEPARILVRHAAALTVQAEALHARIVAGEAVDDEQMTRLSNALGRTLQRLGIKRQPARTKTMAEIAAERRAAAP